ncbi:MAG: hypothetical protein RJB42_1623, partial [Bacteroidota bacterium]
MKKNFNLNKWITALVVLFALSLGSCTKNTNLFDLDINVDPNNPTQGSVKLLLPEAQRNMAGWVQGLSGTQMGMMGQIGNSDSYGLGANGFYGSWTSFYTGWGKDVDEIIKAAKAAGNKPYLGVAQAMKAYGFSMMVDLFGTVPFTEAFGGNAATSNINPKFDDGPTIYAECYKLLDSAIANLNAASTIGISPDIMYSGSKANWIRFANSVKLRMLITSRRANTSAKSQIEAALNPTGGLITGTSNDFTWKYGSQINPELRHPWYTAAYLASQDFSYLEVDMMFNMFLAKDPRFPFYYRRQTTYVLNQNNPTDKGATPVQGAYLVLNPDAWTKGINAGLLSPTKADTQYLAGFFGRYRGDQSGVPQDQDYRTAPGVYPAAGLYDDRSKAPTLLRSPANQGKGDGIFPMITSWMIKFWKAEAELAYSFGDPRKTAEEAVREHIAYVSNFGTSKDANAKAVTAGEVNAYVTNFLAEYDAAPTNEAKMNKVLYQAWIAGWGNGYEAYNAFRRTGYPSNLRTPITLYS